MASAPVSLADGLLDSGALRRRPAGFLGFLATFRRQRLGMIGIVLLSLTVIAAIGAPWLAPYDPNKIDPLRVLESPGAQHWLGTDGLGRDVLSRILYGARVSLYSGFLVVSVSMVIGTVIGLVAGYAGGFIDALLMRAMDALLAFPGLVFALAVTAALGPSLTNAMIAIAVLSFPGAARIVRGEALSLRERDFITAERVLGASPARILFRHILPNALAPIIVIASLRVGGAILIETGLSFLGLGVQPPQSSWGSMVNEGSRFLERAPWISMASGGAIFLAVLGANLVGDAVRDTLDPRLRNE
ncbi:MAG: ABC transporter permease [Tepidiformaceae bacterium]